MSILLKAIYRFNEITIKLPMIVFTELEQIISQFALQHWKLQVVKSNLEKEEWNWQNHPACIQTTLQSYSHQDSMVLAQRQKYRSVEQNRKPRDKSNHLRTLHLLQRKQKYTMEKRQSLHQIVLGKLVNHVQKNETRTLSNTIHKNKLKMG